MLPEDAPALAGDQPPEWMISPKAPRMKPTLLQSLYAPFSASPHTLPPLTPIPKDPTWPSAQPGGLAAPLTVVPSTPYSWLRSPH